MKKNFTSINVILDGSGSMAPLINDTINGYNKFLIDQKELPGDAILSLCIFNTDCRIVHDSLPLKGAPELNNKTYNTMGGTALLDAIGLTVDRVGDKLSAMKEEDRPEKVLFVIITDGEENSSHLLKDGGVAIPSKKFYKNDSIPRSHNLNLKYPLLKIKDMIDHQQFKYNWEFLYFGANVDAFAEGKSLGISRHNTMGYLADSAGTKDMYQTISNQVSDYRMGK